MTESVDPNDYPLPLAALKFLCAHDVWVGLRAAEARWHKEASAIGLDSNRSATAEAAYLQEARVRRTKTFAGFIDYSVGLPRFTHEFGDALHNLSDHKSRCKKSSIARLQNGEIRVLKRREADDDSRWSEFEPDRVRELDFLRDPKRVLFNSHDLKNRKWLEVRLRDTVGVPPDQAVYVYGDVHAVGRLQQIERGELLAKTSSAVVDVAEKAEASYRLEFHLIAAALLNQMRTGELVGVHAGQILLRQYWSELDVSAPIESWYPCVLIRTPTAAERLAEDKRDAPSSEVRPPGGRPTVMPDILKEYLLTHVAPDGKLRLSDAGPASKVLYSWAQKTEWKTLGLKGEVPHPETIEGQVRKLNNWLHRHRIETLPHEDHARDDLISSFRAEAVAKPPKNKTDKP